MESRLLIPIGIIALCSLAIFAQVEPRQPPVALIENGTILNDTELARQYIEEAKLWHECWASIVKRKPEKAEYVGDETYHRMWIRRYELVLRVLGNIENG